MSLKPPWKLSLASSLEVVEATSEQRKDTATLFQHGTLPVTYAADHANPPWPLPTRSGRNKSVVLAAEQGQFEVALTQTRRRSPKHLWKRRFQEVLVHHKPHSAGGSELRQVRF